MIKNSRQRQLVFELFEQKTIKKFGGSLLVKSNAKFQRPITTKKPMHLVLRAIIARGQLSLLRKERQIWQIISKQSKRFGVKVYRQANGGNHLHLIIKPRSRDAFNGFVRSSSGLIARLILGVEKGSAKGIKFWDQRPFTRLMEWGLDFKYVCEYLEMNKLEAWGFIPYKKRNIFSTA